MNITNYELINSIANNTLNVTKNPEGNYDTLALKIFRSDCPYFAAPVNEVTINGETIFKYDLANFTAIENINMKMIARKDRRTILSGIFDRSTTLRVATNRNPNDARLLQKNTATIKIVARRIFVLPSSL